MRLNSRRLGNGTLTAKISEVKNHARIHTEIDGPLILMYRGRLGGWTPSPHAMMLNHQLYYMKVFSIVESLKAREIAAVNPKTGEWETIWVHKHAEPQAETSSCNTSNTCNTKHETEAEE